MFTLDRDGSLTVLLIDDHPLFCDAMAMTIENIYSNCKIKTASTLAQSLTLLSDQVEDGNNPDLIMLDLNLPDVDGIEGLVRLREMTPDAKIVVVSAMSDPQITTAVLGVGANGFVSKDSPRHEWIKAFDTIASGQIYTPSFLNSPDSASTSEGHNPQSPTDQEIIRRLQSLTQQQYTILMLICRGKLNKQIAYDLSIAESTVKAHLTAIMRKLGVQKRTQAVLMAQKVRYTTPQNNPS